MTPGATYRLQLHAGFTFDDASAVVGYLARLGVTHLYLSPSLQAAPGSAHGYDVVDPTRLNADLGGDAGFDRLWEAARAADLGLVLDIVPNHVGLIPRANRWWWDVLEHGRQSAFAGHFDIDWDRHGDGRVVLPDLGAPLEQVLAAGEIAIVEEDGTRHLAYHDHRWPLRPDAPVDGDLRTVVDNQHYRLVHWRRANEELNYRRFFDVTALGGVRIEDPKVFDDTHSRVLSLIEQGRLAGLRVDHPDGLADPTGYAQQLREAAPHAWLVFEKILEHGERPRDDWPIDGTVGYEFLNLALGQFVDPDTEAEFTVLYDELMGGVQDYERILRDAKRGAVEHLLITEHHRLADLLVSASDGTIPTDAARAALVEVLVAHPVYRTYVRPVDDAVGSEDDRIIAHTMASARAIGHDLAGALDVVEDLWRLRRRSEPGDEFVLRLQQVTGPVMAKGIEDTTFYRYLRLTALNEVGGNPGQFGTTVADWHDASERRNRDWPATMLTTSTHDTKRSEDVRARLAAASQVPEVWRSAFARFETLTGRHVGATGPSANHRYLTFQTLVGAWPITGDRLVTYLIKAAREEKRSTSWLDPDEHYEKDLEAFARASVEDPAVVAAIEEYVDRVRGPGQVVSLAQTLLKLTSPGVPDIYQGTEVWDHSLVDPDNRRPVDFGRLADLLDRLHASPGPAPGDVGSLDDGLVKLWVTAQALATRRRHSDAFTPGATYEAVLPEGPQADDVIAYLRGGMVLTVVPRRVRPMGEDTLLVLPPGTWTDVLAGRSQPGGPTRLVDLLEGFPVALLTLEAA